MAAEKIIIPCRFWPSRAQNPNASFVELPIGGSHFQPRGVLCQDAVDSNFEWVAMSPIPGWVHATTPNGKMRVRYVPSVGSGVFKSFLQLESATIGTTSFNISSGWDFDSNVTDTVAAANVPRSIDFSLTSIAASLVSGRLLFGLSKRLASTDAADTVAGSILVFAMEIVLDDDV